MDRVIYIDDPIRTEATRKMNDADRGKVQLWSDAVFLITTRGEYLNRFGERVTWESSGDGRYVALHTWPSWE